MNWEGWPWPANRKTLPVGPAMRKPRARLRHWSAWPVIRFPAPPTAPGQTMMQNKANFPAGPVEIGFCAAERPKSGGTPNLRRNALRRHYERGGWSGPSVRNEANFRRAGQEAVGLVSRPSPLRFLHVPGPAVQTKPIGRRLGRSSVQNKPNLGMARMKANWRLENELRESYADSACAKTKPICEGIGVQGAGTGDLPPDIPRLNSCAKQSQFRRVVCPAKQTQFRGTPWRVKQRHFPAVEDPIIPSFHHSKIPIPGLACETKPFREGVGAQGSGASNQTPGLSCETKPICPGWVWKTIPKAGSLEAATREGANAQNKANLGRRQVGARAASGTSRAKQSQLAGSGRKGKLRARKELWRIGPPQGLGKTKPIRRGVGVQGPAT
jgi:hypothetical protein